LNLDELKKEMPEIFEQVRHDVKTIYGRHRAGLSLGLVDMGMYRGAFIGGMHFAPGHDIVMNTKPLEFIIKEHPHDIIRAYTYHILLHEYIHSLGVLDETMCRQITLNISEEIFQDESHPAVVLAKKGLGILFPNLKLIYSSPNLSPEGLKIEYIKGFDRESYSYYS